MSQHNTNTNGKLTTRPNVPEAEVLPKPKRRTFTAAYKLCLLHEADQCTQPGAVGALLRREGLYSSHLATWRRQREQGRLQGLSAQKRGRGRSLRRISSGASWPSCTGRRSSSNSACTRPRRSLKSKKNVARYWGCRPTTSRADGSC